jgi:hypothetical protein
LGCYAESFGISTLWGDYLTIPYNKKLGGLSYR